MRSRKLQLSFVPISIIIAQTGNHTLIRLMFFCSNENCVFHFLSLLRYDDEILDFFSKLSMNHPKIWFGLVAELRQTRN